MPEKTIRGSRHPAGQRNSERHVNGWRRSCDAATAVRTGEEEERRGFVLLVSVFSHRNSEAARRVSLFVFVLPVGDGDGSTAERKRVARRVSLFMLCDRGTREFEGGGRCEKDKVLQRVLVGNGGNRGGR
ncbi:hypothetical protein HAX54_023622 [Datura stramonium]|uniref:Uncharacterized protein n=1 Tax=Datura stramonium TaxID=4076 RepID=A0ABS8S4U4_DATST|nr:hypothetical protein [Datura stramonium]